MSTGGPRYAATVLALATALAVLISAISGHHQGNPTAGLPIFLLGVIAAEGPTCYRAFADGASDADLTRSVTGGLLGFSVGTVASLTIVVLLVAHWARRNDGEQ
ncbi:hypothetical protein [Streptomyces bottropensis]|uniref:hypothetical protein n=1 Tax=Streptomyces bottropensis TaxID=42235 RepID=UPI003696EEE6